MCEICRGLKAEVERLRAGHSALRASHENLLDAHAETLAEVERLRANLQWLVRQIDDVERTSVIREGNIYHEARQALEEEED